MVSLCIRFDHEAISFLPQTMSIHKRSKIKKTLRTFPRLVNPCSSATRLASSSPPGTETAQVGVKWFICSISSSEIILWLLLSFKFAVITSMFLFEMSSTIDDADGVDDTSLLILLTVQLLSPSTRRTYCWFIINQMVKINFKKSIFNELSPDRWNFRCLFTFDLAVDTLIYAFWLTLSNDFVDNCNSFWFKL